MTTAIYIAVFVGIVALLAGGATLFWRRWVNRMPSPPNWMEAFRVIWVDVYRMDWAKRPRVVWVVGQSFAHNGAPVAGIADQRAVTVAFSPGARVSETAFAHELRHASRRTLGVDPDGKHLSGDWQPGGIVAQAQEALKGRGL